MIKWIRSKLYYGFSENRTTCHTFVFADKQFSLRNLEEGAYPPFDCILLSREDAIGLRDFLDECLCGYE